MKPILRALSLFAARSRELIVPRRTPSESESVDSLVQPVLLSIFRAANTAESVGELFAETRLQLAQLIDTTNLYVALYDERTDLYSLPYHVDQYETEVQPPQKLSGSLTDYVRRTGQPLLASERVHEELMRHEELKLVGLPSAIWLGAPLITDGAVLGVVAVQSYEDPDLYSQRDLELLTFVAENIAQMVHRKRAEQGLRDSEKRFRDLFEVSPDGIFVEDLDGNVIDANPAACRLQRIDRDQLIGMNVADLVPAEAKEGALADFRRLANGEIAQLEGLSLTGDGDVLPVEVRATALEYSNKPALLVQVRDITERMEHKRRLEQLAHFDPLTGLANRFLFEDRMRQAILNTRRSGGRVALLYLDLDEFKNVNDMLGHLIGDELLKVVASRLADQVRGTDSVARLGGDEFGVIQGEIESPAGISALALRILESMSRPFKVNGHELHTSTSIGISVSSLGEDSVDLMLQADRALRKAKQRGGGNFQFHDEDLAKDVDSYVSLRHDLHGAIERSEFILDYQPQVDLSTGELVGSEALIRWQHPRRGLLYPGSFIPVTENTSLIIPLSFWVLEESCRQNREWSRRGLPELSVAVNLSAANFRDPLFTKTLDEILAKTGHRGELLELELTETILMQGSDEVQEALHLWSERGISFAIDDFGTGYSSLRYLREFPVHKLKIAMEFVQGATNDADDAAIVDAVISLGHNLGMTVIAEGVETEEQLNFLRDHGCDEAQGYYFSRPVAPDAFAELLNKQAN